MEYFTPVLVVVLVVFVGMTLDLVVGAYQEKRKKDFFLEELQEKFPVQWAAAEERFSKLPLWKRLPD